MSFSTSAVEGLAIYGDDTFDVETLIKDQETLEVLGHTFQLAATPGHTYNHKAVVTPDGICFLGDGLMNDVTLETAKFAVVTNLNRHFETIEFIRRLPYRQFILGHGAHIYNPEELAALCGRNRQYFEQKYREILRLLTPEKTFDSLMHTLGAQYGLRRNLFKYYVAERSIKAVLSYLESVGAIRIHVVGGVLTYTTLNQPQKSDVQRASYS
jgi:glyoxylase-like metal-dependent hydrolase (beta-lactamase superfamily II)